MLIEYDGGGGSLRIPGLMFTLQQSLLDPSQAQEKPQDQSSKSLGAGGRLLLMQAGWIMAPGLSLGDGVPKRPGRT